jgi:hypothetical protein
LGADTRFRKTGGIIYGFPGDEPSKSNKADSGQGHAVFVANSAKGYPKRNTTIGAGENLSYTGAENEAAASLTGTWDD